MGTPIVNFGLVTVSAGYSSGATSITLEAGDGSILPDTTGGYTYPATWWNATDYAHPADDPNAEIVLVTSRATDTLTITRAQEGTTASAKNIAGKTYRMLCGITKRMWDDLQRPKSFVQGLQLQTHRDSDLAAKQVELVDVDSIIMDDGTELRNDNGEWSGKVADITVSGAGGLDTGVELPSEWYEIYAIAKEDGTRNLLLHDSKLWVITTVLFSGSDSSQGIRSAVDNSTVKVAQGFQLNDSGPCIFVDVQLLKTGSPTGKIWFTIESDNAGKPSGSAVATSYAYDVSRLTTNSTDVRIPMKVSQALSVSTQYHLVAQGTWTISATNYVSWRMDTTSPAYAFGSKALFDSDTSTWTTVSGHDMMCKIGVEINNTAVTMPSGYTKKCFLGWVYNQSSSDFAPFLQVQRSVIFTSLSIASNRVVTLSGAQQLIDAYGFIPPRKLLKVRVALSGTGTAGALLAVGDLRATDISSASTSVGAQAIMSTAITSLMPSQFGDVILQATAIMAMGTSGAYLWITGYEW